MAQEFDGLEVRGLARRVGTFELEADFKLGRSERMVIQAASGAGKSSLLRILAGLESADRGNVSLNGLEITRLAPPQRQIGVVFQDAALFDSLNVIDNAAFGLRMRGFGKKERHEQALRWLKKVGLSAQAGRSVRHLSGGEKQQVAFVRALVWKPRLLLLDEPFSALDQGLRSTLRAELKSLLAEWPVPMILVTHDREDTEALATTRWEIAEVAKGVRRLQKLN